MTVQVRISVPQGQDMAAKISKRDKGGNVLDSWIVKADEHHDVVLHSLGEVILIAQCAVPPTREFPIGDGSGKEAAPEEK